MRYNINVIPIEFNLTKFIKIGKFGFLELGMTKKEIINQHFPPQDWLKKKLKKTLKFGDMETLNYILIMILRI